MNRNVLSSGKTEFPSYIFFVGQDDSMSQLWQWRLIYFLDILSLVTHNTRKMYSSVPLVVNLTETRKRTTQANALTVAKLIKKVQTSKSNVDVNIVKTVNYFPDKSSGPPRHRLFRFGILLSFLQKSSYRTFLQGAKRARLKAGGRS